jgi:hypothetical protein
MLRNADTGGLNAYNGSADQVLAMEFGYDLYGEADDPLYLFDVNRPVNQRQAKLHGWELGGQYFFGESGFGIYANYTLVEGDVAIDNAGDPGIDQFALLGLSDTANAMLMYEKFGWSVRLAYNWRDEYLILANQGGSRNPFYVESYQQWDLSASYRLNENMTLGLGHQRRARASAHRRLDRRVIAGPRALVACDRWPGDRGDGTRTVARRPPDQPGPAPRIACPATLRAARALIASSTARFAAIDVVSA